MCPVCEIDAGSWISECRYVCHCVDGHVGSEIVLWVDVGLCCSLFDSADSTEGSVSSKLWLVTVMTYCKAMGTRVVWRRLAFLHLAARDTAWISDFGTAISVSEGVVLHCDKYESASCW